LLFRRIVCAASLGSKLFSNVRWCKQKTISSETNFLVS
jgi:hypothetical protein